MPGSSFTIKQGDLYPSLEAVLSDDDGPIDLSSASGVTFRFHHKGSGATFSAAAVVVNPATGLVRYQWSAGDTDKIGDYWGEFVINWSGSTETIPSTGFVEFSVSRTLA